MHDKVKAGLCHGDGRASAHTLPMPSHARSHATVPHWAEAMNARWLSLLGLFGLQMVHGQDTLPFPAKLRGANSMPLMDTELFRRSDTGTLGPVIALVRIGGRRRYDHRIRGSMQHLLKLEMLTPRSGKTESPSSQCESSTRFRDDSARKPGTHRSLAAGKLRAACGRGCMRPGRRLGPSRRTPSPVSLNSDDRLELLDCSPIRAPLQVRFSYDTCHTRIGSLNRVLRVSMVVMAPRFFLLYQEQQQRVGTLQSFRSPVPDQRTFTVRVASEVLATVVAECITIAQTDRIDRSVCCDFDQHADETVDSRRLEPCSQSD